MLHLIVSDIRQLQRRGSTFFFLRGHGSFQPSSQSPVQIVSSDHWLAIDTSMLSLEQIVPMLDIAVGQEIVLRDFRVEAVTIVGL